MKTGVKLVPVIGVFNSMGIGLLTGIILNPLL
jgi:hypothetical protein